MKQVYICEKCGQEFESWDECYACENGHIMSFGNKLEPETQKRLKYKPGCAAPTKIIMATEHYDSEQGSFEPDSKLWVYKLVGPAQEQETAEIFADYEKRKADEAAWYADYQRRKAEREAEQEAAKIEDPLI